LHFEICLYVPTLCNATPILRRHVLGRHLRGRVGVWMYGVSECAYVSNLIVMCVESMIKVQLQLDLCCIRRYHIVAVKICMLGAINMRQSLL